MQGGKIKNAKVLLLDLMSAPSCCGWEVMLPAADGKHFQIICFAWVTAAFMKWQMDGEINVLTTILYSQEKTTQRDICGGVTSGMEKFHQALAFCCKRVSEMHRFYLEE